MTILRPRGASHNANCGSHRLHPRRFYHRVDQSTDVKAKAVIWAQMQRKVQLGICPLAQARRNLCMGSTVAFNLELQSIMHR